MVKMESVPMLVPAAFAVPVVLSTAVAARAKPLTQSDLRIEGVLN